MNINFDTWPSGPGLPGVATVAKIPIFSAMYVDIRIPYIQYHSMYTVKPDS